MTISTLIKFLIIGLVYNFSQTYSLAQKRRTVLVEKISISPASSKKMIFGLQAGDSLVLNFEEANGKKFSEIKIQGYDGGTVLFAMDTKEVLEKKTTIAKTGIYELSLTNKSLDSRSCKVKIERIPKGSNDTFDSKVYTAQLADTTWYTEKEDYLVSIDTTIIPVVGHHTLTIGPVTTKNKAFMKVELPFGIKSWAYWLGVGSDTERAFISADEASTKYKNLVADTNGSAVMARLVLDGNCSINVPLEADNIQYWFATDEEDVQAFLEGQNFFFFDKGNAAMAFERKVIPNSGAFYICFLNDNNEEPVDVHIRVATYMIKENRGEREVKKYTVKTYEELYLKN